MPFDERFEGLVAGARAGDEWALRAFYEEFSPLVRGYLRNQGVAEPDDLLGEVFLRAVRNIAWFQGDEAELRAWILKLAHRRLVEEGRHRPRRLSVSLVRDSDRREGRPAPGAAPRDADREERMRGMLDNLSFDQRSVVLLRSSGNLTVEQVGEVMGKTPRAVRRLQQRGLAILARSGEVEPREASAPAFPAEALTRERARDLVTELRSLADHARRMEHEAQALIGAAERTIATVEDLAPEGQAPGLDEPLTDWRSTGREEALLRATQLAIQGRQRAEIEATLSDELAIENATEIVDQILGPGRG
jgi:RNA polymerase sigma-70 factor (ECF subfamily)